MLERIMYNRRSKGNPYWNTLIIAGFDTSTNKPFMGQIDSKGSSFESGLIGTGFGGFLVHPLMERELEKIPGPPTTNGASELLKRTLLQFWTAKSLRRTGKSPSLSLAMNKMHLRILCSHVQNL